MITLRSATVRLYRPTFVHVPVANIRTSSKGNYGKDRVKIRQVYMEPEVQVATLVSSVQNAGVIIAPRKLMSFAETPNMSPQALLAVIKLMHMIKSKDGGVITSVLNSLRKLNLSEEIATQTWKAVQDSDIPLDAARLELMLGVFAKCNMTEAVIALANRGFKENLIGGEELPNIASYLLQHGNREECFDLVKRAHENGVEKNTNIMYNIINNVARVNAEEGTKLFFDMLEQNMKPDYPTVSMLVFHIFTLMDGSKRTNTLEKIRPVIESTGYEIRYLLWDVFAHYINTKSITGIKPMFKDWFGTLQQPLPEHPKVDYHLRKHANSKGADWQTACNGTIEAYEALREHNFPPDNSLYMLILSVYDRLGNASQIAAVLSDMLTRDCVTIQAYILGIEAMVRIENIELGKMFYRLGRSTKLVPTPQLYHAALKLAIIAKDLGWARSLFAELKSGCRDIPEVTYSLMIQTLANSSKLDEAMQLMDEMISVNMPKISPQTFVAILSGLANRGNWEKLQHYLQEAKRLEVPFTAEQLKTLKRMQAQAIPPVSSASTAPSASASTSTPASSSTSTSTKTQTKPSSQPLDSNLKPMGTVPISNVVSKVQHAPAAQKHVPWQSTHKPYIHVEEESQPQPLFNHANDNNNTDKHQAQPATQYNSEPTYSNYAANQNLQDSQYNEEFAEDYSSEEYAQTDVNAQYYNNNNYYSNEYNQHNNNYNEYEYNEEYENNASYSQNENLPPSFSPYGQQPTNNNNYYQQQHNDYNNNAYQQPYQQQQQSYQHQQQQQQPYQQHQSYPPQQYYNYDQPQHQQQYPQQQHYQQQYQSYPQQQYQQYPPQQQLYQNYNQPPPQQNYNDYYQQPPQQFYDNNTPYNNNNNNNNYQQHISNVLFAGNHPPAHM